jgi:hypothetical protein
VIWSFSAVLSKGAKMPYKQFEQHRMSRRTLMTTALSRVCGLAAATMVFSKTAQAAGNESAEMTPTDLIKALRSIGKPACLDAADRLAASTGSLAGFDLHLRRVGLNVADARVLANGMMHADAGNALFLKSFSASYNPDLGDGGAAALAEAFPETMTELGLVGCSIGDAGAHAILEWARTAPNLRMICVEGNKISAGVKSQFQDLASGGRNILVVG